MSSPERAPRRAPAVNARDPSQGLQGGPETQIRMVAINAAWELIGDEQRRALWDRAHRGMSYALPGDTNGDATPAAAPAAGAHQPGGHRWSLGMKPGTGAAGPPPGRPPGRGP